jgi:uncharacterized membrane protein YkoI
MPQSAITKRQAMAIAVQAVGGGTAVAAHRDDFRGRPIWEVTVINSPFQYEVTVDSATGQPICISVAASRCRKAIPV